MIAYLIDGWYFSGPPRRLRNEVVDGAIDSASMLFRAGLSANVIHALALSVRRCVPNLPTDASAQTALDVPEARLTEAECKAVRQQLQYDTDQHPILQSFVADCQEHIATAADLWAMYLHLLHIAQMMRLLQVATGPNGFVDDLNRDLAQTHAHPNDSRVAETWVAPDLSEEIELPEEFRDTDDEVLGDKPSS